MQAAGQQQQAEDGHDQKCRSRVIHFGSSGWIAQRIETYSLREQSVQAQPENGKLL
jgi:hypothetical protein